MTITTTSAAILVGVALLLPTGYARGERDLACEADHGCTPIPLTRAMSGALQRTDPRCDNLSVSPQDAEALKQLNELLEPR